METIDNYKNHFVHETYDPQCSTCFSEAQAVKVSAERKLGTPLSELKKCPCPQCNGRI